MNSINTLSTTAIYFTKDYKQFSFITGNRIINEAKIRRIIKDIDNGLDMLKYCPIVVTADMKIIDGQHRFYVAKTLKKAVYYVVANEITLRDIAAINSRTERWKPIDFVRCYIENGNDNYSIVNKFIETYKIPVSAALLVLTNGYTASNFSQHILRQFEAGEFVVKHQSEAQKICEYALRFDQFVGHTSGQFLKAISALFKANKFDENLLAKKFFDNPEILTPQSTHKGYLIKLEEIYNYRNQKRYAIY
jgi:hypothetical protein